MEQASRFGRPDLSRLGRAIRDRRLAAGLSQADLAGRAGIGLRTLGAIESGTSNPALTTALALAAALGTTLDRLVAAAAGGRAAVARGGVWDAPLDGAALSVSIGPADAAAPAGPRMLLVLDGAATATGADGRAHRLAAGDACHARAGALAAVGGTGRVLSVTDTRGKHG